MLIEILISTFIGIVAGTFTGLCPGIHINLIGAILISLSATIFPEIPSVYLVIFIASMAITHTFVDFIPSVFLGYPDTDTELSVLPSHNLLKNRQGYEAVMLSAYGGVFAILMLIFLAFPLAIIIPRIYNSINSVMALILITISLMLIFTEKKKFTALTVFLISGLLGLFALNINVQEPLLPLLTGLFGGSMLIISIKNKNKIPKQRITKPKIKSLKPILGTIISSSLCGFLPGLGSGQAAVIGSSIFKTDQKGFLILLGATNTLVMGFSFISLYALSKTRTGAAAAIKEIIGVLSWKILIVLLIVALISGVISFFLTQILAKFFSKKINKINYSLLSIITLIFLVIIVLIFSGFLGLLVLTASTFVGIYCISLGVRRTNMMGCLLIPTIILYLL